MTFDKLEQLVAAAKRGEVEYKANDGTWRPLIDPYALCNCIKRDNELRINRNEQSLQKETK